jgi:ubiquinone/menaquinone biosynthesis C-methylase UbiE
VTGVDLSPGFIDAATYLTARCGLSDRVTFRVGDALHLPFENSAFDTVFLQHVAMNVEDRAALYAEVRRNLAPGGRLATYDLVLRDGDVVYPAPWARDVSSSFLLSEADTLTALEQDWFKEAMSAPPQSVPNLGVVMGPEFPTMIGNLASNIRENRLGVLSAVLIRD